MERQVERQIAKPSIKAGVKREVLRILEENRVTIVRRAVTPERSVIFIEPDIEVLNEAYAMFDDKVDIIRIQD
jgi:hypothetical protein